MNLDKFKNPRKLLNAWEAQALATLTSKGLPNSFKAVSELIKDESKDSETITAAEILFWGRYGGNQKLKRVVTSWNHLLRLIKHNNYQGIASFEEVKIYGRTI